MLYIVCTVPVFCENTDSLYFRKKQGLYRLGEYVYNTRRHCFPWNIGLGTNTVLAKPCLYRVMFWVGTDTVLGMYRPFTTWNRACTDPECVFLKFRTDSIPALYCAFFEAVTARLQTARVKKVSIPGLRQCTLPVHCRYIACFARYWPCLSRYEVVWSRIPRGFRVFTWSFGGADNALVPFFLSSGTSSSFENHQYCKKEEEGIIL